MASVSKYWKLVSLSVSGKTRVQEIILAKEFLLEQFPDLNEQTEMSDSLMHKRLLKFINLDFEPAANQPNCAELCLRCYISHQIKIICLQLEQQFGRDHNFNRYDLFPLVLDDTIDNFGVSGNSSSGNYQPLAIKILKTFNPQKAHLSTWITRLVRQSHELNLFLLEKGIYLISNWAILNDTSYKQLKRILREFYNLTTSEISQASILLESYHDIYRQNRLEQRQMGIKSKCFPPTEAQLLKIASLIERKDNCKLTSETVLSQLQDLGNLLRQYRLYVKGGKVKIQTSLDAIPGSAERISDLDTNLEYNQQEQRDFVEAYNQQFESCLDISIATVIRQKYNYWIKKKGNKEQYFLMGLDLFHCQGKSMGEIAPLINLKAQYQVTRLLKLKELRTDIRQKLLQVLRDRTIALAKKYSSIKQLQILEDKLENALAEKIDTVIHEAQAEASIAKNRTCNSLLARRLCHYLKLDVK